MMTQLGSLASQTDVFEEILYKMDAIMKANQENMEARIESGREQMETEIKSGLEEVKAADLEANQEEKEVVAEHQKVPNEETAVETI
jgi:hypothetical protein